MRPRRRWPWLTALAVVVVAAGGGIAYALAANGGAASPVNCKGAACGTQTSHPMTAVAHPLSVASTTPTTGATGIASDTTLTVKFSAPIRFGSATPSISPSVTGSWSQAGKSALVFTPAAPFVPYTKYTLTVPGGPTGVEAATGGHLAQSDPVSFTVADGNTTRLQQLLAELGYLPLSYSGTAPAPADMALPQPGTLSWRWTMPQTLVDQWVQGSPSAITKGAVMQFETQNGLAVDGVPGPEVWSDLLADVASHKTDPNPYTYVLVTKTLPEHQTTWVNGALQFSNILVNTGVPGATTHDGTFQVFEHVKASDMKGCDVTGSCYNDPTVPWASYFDGGEALHGFPRANYGYPQSNGCVEMRITTAGRLWPYTVIGTLVTVVGPTAPSSSTTTTAPPSPPPPPG
ncbi:MAG: Ig-like domain-containing protein [Acidimicrobiales bacterium]